ncbi:chromatin remodeling complex protein [Vararia minispora EC-137]|uniref:Chromatin remodeling complex protein n=1 Tax=Vararia minispora EC-137 TaxID=1314806 RepID=A0ACB8QYS3_9AGAM|nr:chromatin remodeling complex protein [Vararia minispora EC-137]
MPTCRRKRVLLNEPSDALLQARESDPLRPVYYLHLTGEIFENYEAYAARISFYRLKQFQCEVTGKSGLDYFEALQSEKSEARIMHLRFPEPLKPAILQAVQWQVMGRLDHLVEAVFERYKDRYFKDEKIYVDIQGQKFLARVVEVYPPRVSSKNSVNGTTTNQTPGASSSNGAPELHGRMPVHAIGGDLKVPAKEINATDDPTKYLYKVQILEEERPEGARDKLAASTREARAKWNGSLMEVQCGLMSRDRLAFSKSILRRFIRDCVDRDAAVASPWTVKPPIAARYGVSSVMPEATRQGVEDIKKGEIQKRKKVWEDKEPPAKKQKRLAEEKGASPALGSNRDGRSHAERKERDAQVQAERQKASEEAERAAAEKKKKKPLRYPTEDLDVTLSEKDKKAGAKLKRPVPNKLAIPFSENPTAAEAFLMTWNFLVVYGHPLHLSTFTMDEYEAALRHRCVDPPCQLLAEIHSTLIYLLRTVNFQRHSAILSLQRLEDAELDEQDSSEEVGILTSEVVSGLADVGNNWERAPLRYSEGRAGWEESLVGCLKDHATVDNFPSLRRIFARLLYGADPGYSGSSNSEPGSSRAGSPLSPMDGYAKLPPEDRLAILSFLCDIAVSSKAIHQYMESCEEQLTALRKEKIEVNRSKRQFIEERDALLGGAKDKEEGKEKAAENGNGAADDEAANGELSDLSDVSTENGSESGSKPAKGRDLRRKAQSQAHAKQREAARAQAASQKKALAEHRRLDEEVNKLERRLEGIEREFRKLLGSIRVKPLGRDRFYNRVWWFDGMGAASLVGSGGTVQYQTGRLFIQGPSPFDKEIMDRREDNVWARRQIEEGEEGWLGVGEWAVFGEIEEIDQFAAWLNPKGLRELALKNQLTKWWPHIAPGMRKRHADLNTNAKLPEARRSSRVKSSGPDVAREAYMQWTNRRALTT